MITVIRSIMMMIMSMIKKKIPNLPLVTRAGGQEGLHRWRRRRPGGKERSAGAKVVAAVPSDE